jgi:nucleoside-diphosphate-sugar epimerase
MKILLTGATGFIGKYVLNELVKKDYEVSTLSRSQGCDLLNHGQVDEFLRKSRADILIHLAWDVTHGEFWNSPKNILYRNASIFLFKKFLDYGGKKIIGGGTCAEYPTSDQEVVEDIIVTKEDLSLYGKCKRECFEWLEKNLCDFTWLRIFNVYGDSDHPQKLFPSILRSLKEGKDFSIKNPNSFYDYTWVGDVAKCIAEMINKPGLGAVNVGTGQSMATQDWYNSIKKNIIIKTIQKANAQSRIPNCKKLQKNGFFLRNLIPFEL